MPRLRKYRLFICHSWDYDEYHRIKEWLDLTPNFTYSNYSVPYDNALDIKGKTKLKEGLKRLIRPSQVVLVSAGMEVNYREFVLFEIDFAQELAKPIIGIVPRGGLRIPKKISDAACELVGWNRMSIINAIRRNAL
jgi:MTH538 TIR-like domain (DUF1863)